MTSLRLLVFLLSVVVVGCVEPGADTPETTAPLPPETTTTAAETTTTLVGEGAGTGELPEGIREELDSLIVRTQELRELAFVEAPDFNVVTADELSTLVRDSIEEDLEDVDVDQALYEVLGLLDAETDLATLYVDLLTEQVAGYYDLDTRELVVPMRAEGFSALERSTIVHELTHALTDQHFGIADLSEQLSDEERYDEAAALLALIEGDAVVTELMYLQTLPLEDQRAMLEESLGMNTPALDASPQFLVDSLIFPYVEGPVFVQRLMELGGVEAVDAAYGDPPVSTEQIFSPQDYQTDLPIDVEVPQLTIEGYEVEERSVWGELGLQLMLDQILGERVDAVNGWGGDEYVVMWDGAEVALVLSYAGDDPADVEELRTALLEYAAVVTEEGAEEDGGGSSFSGDDYLWVGSVGDRLHFVAAGDPAVGADLVAQLTGD